MKKFWCLLALLALTPVAQGATGGNITYNVSSAVYNKDIIGDDEKNEEIDSLSNTITVKAGEFNGNIISGQSQTGHAGKNEVRLYGGTVNSANVKAGVSQKKDATDNRVRVRDLTLQSNIVAGTAAVGTASGNVVTLYKSTVNLNAPAQNKVVAGETFSGIASKNTIEVTEQSALDTTAAAGYSSDAGEVSNNLVSVTGGSKLLNSSGSNAVYGGYSKDGAALNNEIYLQDAAEASAALYGGYSVTSTAERNLVRTDKAVISGDVYGGYSATGTTALKNEVRLGAQTQFTGDIYGGYALDKGNAEKNKVSVASGATAGADAQIYGGYSVTGDAANNDVSLSSASVGKAVYGGYAGGAAGANTVAVAGANDTAGELIAGGWSTGGVASYNKTAVNNSTLTLSQGIYGGYGAKGAASNELAVSYSAFTGMLYGGYAASGAANSNKVSVTGGSVAGNVYGGYSADGEASGNRVELSGVTVTGDVYGGYTASASADTPTAGNTIVLTGNTVINGDFYGGNGLSSGNSLLLNNYSGTINAINAIDSVTLYGLASNVTFTTPVTAGVILHGRPSEISQTLAYTPAGSSLTLDRNVLGAYVYGIEGVPQGAQVAWNVRGQYENELAKPYAQAQLAGLALGTVGDDMLSAAFNEAMLASSDNNMFAGVQYYDNSYKTGSGFDMQSFAVQIGRWFKTGENALGLFAQYAHGHYSTDPKDATGGIDGFALGGFALLPYSDAGRFEAVLRGGYQKEDFNSDELSSDLDTDGFYGGLSAGVVQELSALQLYGKINWLYLAGDNVHDSLGQSIKFKDVQSLSGKFGARLDLGTVAGRYKPYIGAAGIYEFDGESDVRVDGHRVHDAELKGMTGQGEIGVSYENPDAMMPMKSTLSVFGLTGRTKGWGMDVKLAFSF